MKRMILFTLMLAVLMFSTQAFAQQTWVRQNSNTPVHLNSVHFIDANTGTIVGLAGAILRTTNGGQTWTFQTSNTPVTLNDVFFTDANTGTAVGLAGTILRTTNGGQTWTFQRSNTPVDLNAVHFVNANIGTAVGLAGTILRTTNGGQTWTFQTSNTPVHLNDVFFTDANTGTAVGLAGTILRTTNGGQTWVFQRSNTPVDLNAVHFVNANIGTAVGLAGTILRTNDGGQNWSFQRSNTPVTFNDVFFTDANTGTTAGLFGTILRTTDGGQTWTFQNTNTSLNLNSVYFTDVNTGTAVGIAGLILRTATCNFSISPNNRSFGGTGGSGSVNVTSLTGCLWTAVSNVDWITITIGNNGNGNGIVRYQVAASNVTTTRTGTATIAGQTFTVTQTPCSFTISPTSRSFNANGGAGFVNVTTSQGCGWTAVSNVDWITITSGSTGTGSQVVNFTVAATTSTAPRTGTLTVAGKTFTVTQSACAFAIAPTSQLIAASGGLGSVNVTACAGAAWTAVSNDNWITITSGNNGTGNGTVNYTVAANGTTNSRTGSLTIAGQTHVVNQAGVSAINRPPQVANQISNQTLVVGAVFTRDLNTAPEVFYDPDGDPLSYSATSSAPGIATAMISTGTLTVNALGTGSAAITVTANDGKGGTTPMAFTAAIGNPPGTGCWTQDDFDNLFLTCLDGQNGWATVPGRACAPVIADPGGSGNVLELNPGSGQTIIMSKIVNTQTSGVHELALRVMVEHQNIGAQSMAKIEVNTPNGTFWDKKFQLYFGESMRLNYSPTDEINFLANVVAGRWYEVRAIFDVTANRLDLLVDGVQALTNLPIGAGPITEVRLNGFDYPGRVLLDDIRGCVSNFAPSVNLVYNQVDVTMFPIICSYVTITDGRGNPITGLDSTNFVVVEDGQTQNPVKVTPVGSTNDPIAAALVIDRSGSMAGQPLQDAKTAANIFVNQMSANDRAAVISFSSNVTVDQTFTSDKSLLSAAINALTSGGGTAIYDALIEAVKQIDTQTGRKAILLLTDGEDVSSSATLQQAINAALQSGVPVFTIGLGLASGSAAEQNLQQIANGTGGRYYFAPNSADLQQIYQLISQQLRSQYKITYTTHNPNRDGSTRNVQITVNYQSLSATKSRTYMAPRTVSTLPVIAPNVSSPQTAGQEFWVDLKVGDNITTVANLFGVSFELNYTNTGLIDVVTPTNTAVLAGPFLGNDLVFISNVDETAGKVSLGISRKQGQSGVDGSGIVARVKFKSLSSTPANTPVVFTLSNLAAVDPASRAINLTTLPDTVIFTPVTTPVVWPGDANNDGIVNQADILPLGLHWRRTGPRRPNASTAWIGQPSPMWTPLAATYANANGDTVINQADVLPIGINWNKTHTGNFAKTGGKSEPAHAAGGAGLKPEVNPSQQSPGQEFFIRIKAAEAADFFGLSFELLYDRRQLLQILAVEPDSLMGNDAVFIAQVDTAAGKISVGISRKAGQAGVNGNGSVVRVKAKLSFSARGGDVVNLSLQNAVADNSTGAPISLTPGSASIFVLTTAVDGKDEAQVITDYRLEQNYPNPFNPGTLIKYQIPQAGQVMVKVYNFLGQEVRTLVNRVQPVGSYQITWDSRDERGQVVPSGIYFYRLEAGSFVQVRKMTLLR